MRRRRRGPGGFVLRLLGWGLLAAAVLAGLLAAAARWWLQQPLPLARDVVELTVEPGAQPREVARAWVAAGVQLPAELLYAWFRFSGEDRRILAGSYALQPGDTPRSLLAKLVQEEATLRRVRLIEGWTWRQWRAELARAPQLRPVSARYGDAELLAALGLGPDPGPDRKPADGAAAFEGRFLPATYTYSAGVSDLSVLRHAAQAMRRELDAQWAQRAPDHPLQTPEQALVLASIIEKETGHADDRAQVAAVFVNRLRLGMPLQTDPSVIYGLGAAFDGNLRRSDLRTDTPYNTYTRRGLPPTPIAMPGAAALRAALHPAPSSALYFVARGDGRSVFSQDLVAHNRAVNRYQRPAPPTSPRRASPEAPR